MNGEAQLVAVTGTYPRQSRGGLPPLGYQTEILIVEVEVAGQLRGRGLAGVPPISPFLILREEVYRHSPPAFRTPPRFWKPSSRHHIETLHSLGRIGSC